MTMYLSNHTVRPTGYELVEFVEAPPLPEDADVTSARRTPEDEREGSSNPVGSTAPDA